MTEFAPSYRCWVCGRRGERDDLCFPVTEDFRYDRLLMAINTNIACRNYDLGSLDHRSQRPAA
jgi:hypothetical protein